MRSTPLAAERGIAVLVPPSYSHHVNRRYGVLYIHDGKHAFDLDPRFPNDIPKIGVDTCLDSLFRNKESEEFIVVAIDSMDGRHQEYSPAVYGQKYARFIIDQLKPFIDSEFRTKPTPEHTASLGCSLGGLISVYLATMPNAVFGLAAGLSTCFWDVHPDDSDGLESYYQFLKSTQCNSRIYLDYGTNEFDEGNLEEAKQAKKAIKLSQKVATHLASCSSLRRNQIIFEIVPGGKHHESSWRERLHVPLKFLFPKTNP
ncbi:MAG: alpha/beta hydrolase-fold protein [Verrucomicrobiota bacterium]|nr:alpha/beta hydrolase-fold protein [Verrucomicrobiota bacterium]